ncbi:F-box protein At5g03100-like [Rutidosis leptorrhynchoides]|uniref:F-box protein At5g03100-like n=1 Tax=Rutidosis leptorrhynchoides TaxID=125765 RepID=UPI003A9A0B57
MNAEEVDRLSNLPDDLINKILSFSDTKDAIRTSVLSSRWKNTWKSIPHLDFSLDHLTSLPKFYECVNRVLPSRNNEIELESAKLDIHREVSQTFVKKILNYAFTHSVQKMTISYCFSRDIEFPMSLFISRSLKDLTLIGLSYHYTKITSTWDLPALTTLCLDGVKFKFGDNYNELCGLFSKCPNLKNLTLTKCEICHGCGPFITISHPQLSTLNVINGYQSYAINVVAPHLKFLTVVNCQGGLISAPELSSLTYEMQGHFTFSTDGLFSLEKVDFYICYPDKEDAPKIIDMLQQFRNVKYLTLGLEIVEVLASSVQLVSHLPSPFANLTSFKIYPANIDHFPRPLHKSQPSRMKEEEQENLKMPTEVKNYVLDGSPNAIVTIFSRQDMKALENAKAAQQILLELQMLLAKQKYKC